MKNNKKIKWVNILKFMILISCLLLIINDIFMITIYGWITNNMASWTWFGFGTFVLALVIAILILDDFDEQLNKKRELVKNSQLNQSILVGDKSIPHLLK